MIDLKKIRLVDSVTILALAILNLLHFIFPDKVLYWKLFSFLNLTFIFLIIYSSQKNNNFSKFFYLLWQWYPIVSILYIFKQSYFMVHQINPNDYDWLLIKIDKIIFGVDPTVWIGKFANPILTEILQLAYVSYYFILFSVVAELFLRKKFSEFYDTGFLICYGFYLSYIGYFLLPAVGPRFTLHDFNLLNSELPGIFFTESIRNFIDAAESIPTQITNAIDFVQRDVFPSGHVQLSLVAIYCAFKYKLSVRWIIIILGALLIISTIYLRYHYAIDVIFGIIFFIFTIWSGKRLEEKIKFQK